jgi:hypothetical protein
MIEKRIASKPYDCKELQGSAIKKMRGRHP